jgi:hypothetical protein
MMRPQENAVCIAAVKAVSSGIWLPGARVPIRAPLNLPGSAQVVLRNNSDAASDEERARLQTAGCFHLGEFVNAMRHGSLVMRLPDSELASIPTLLFGGVEGAIGVMASLPQELYALLEKLQGAMQKVGRACLQRDWATQGSHVGRYE